MLTNNDLSLLLMDLDDSGVEGASKMLANTLGKPGVDFAALRFVTANRQLDVAGFYERMRRNYNEKRSDLYKNIVKGEWDADKALSTLHAFALQAFLYSTRVAEDDKPMFYRHVRAEEVSRVLHEYYGSYDLSGVLKVLSLLKADLTAFEAAAGRR